MEYIYKLKFSDQSIGAFKLRLRAINWRVAQWLATCTRKPKAPGSSPAASYVQR